MEIAGFGVEEWLNQWEKSATYDISQSTIDSMTMKEALSLDGKDGEEFYKLLDRKKMNYGWIEGSPEFKKAVGNLYSHVDVDNILQTNGASGANHLALYALLNPGDHVISEYPSYQQLYDIPKSLGADVDYWKIHEDQDWYPNIAELKRLIRPDTKLICLNNANNPTWTFLDKSFLQQVVDLAKKVGAYVLVDEVYMPLTDTDRYASIVDLYDRGIATNSVSKTYSMPGLRVGWTVSNKAVADLFRKYRDYTMISCGVFNDAWQPIFYAIVSRSLTGTGALFSTIWRFIKSGLMLNHGQVWCCHKQFRRHFLNWMSQLTLRTFVFSCLKNREFYWFLATGSICRATSAWDIVLMRQRFVRG